MILWRNKKKCLIFGDERKTPVLSYFMLNTDVTPTSNFQPIRLLDPSCSYKFKYLMTNSAEPDQLAS